MKIVVFITNYTEDLCSGVARKERGNRLKSSLSRFDRAGSFLCFRPEAQQILAIHKERPISDDSWNALADIVDAESRHKIAVAFHHGNDVVHQAEKCFEKSRVVSVGYSHECDEKEPWFLFSQLIDDIEKQRENNPAAFLTLFKRIYKDQPSRDITQIKHKLVHLFLPLEVDFQGLEVVDFREDYWADVAAQYREKDLREKIEVARSLLYRRDNENFGEQLEDVLTERGLLQDAAWLDIKRAIPAVVKLDVIENVRSAFLNDDKAAARTYAAAYHEWYRKLLTSLEILFSQLH